MSSWATRCNACGTSFRVSEEQLSISDGFVRCGRCDTVFNARSSLFDLDALSSAPMPLPPPPPPPPAPAVLPPEPEPEPIEFAPSDEAAQPQADEALPQYADGTATTADPTWAPEPEPPAAAADAPPSRSEPSWVDEVPPADFAPEPALADETAPPPQDDEAANLRMRDLLGADATPAAATSSDGVASWPSLEKQERKATQAKPSAAWTAAGSLLAALLVLALPLQWAWVEREALRAKVPQLDAWLSAHWPSLASPGWRHLESLSVGGSSLQATPQGGAYRLELVLHNRATHRVAMPWLDLKLSDSTGQLLLRRSVSPEELGAAQPLEAGEQRKLEAVFRIQDGSAPVNGYEIGLFHP